MLSFYILTRGEGEKISKMRCDAEHTFDGQIIDESRYINNLFFTTMLYPSEFSFSHEVAKNCPPWG